MHAPGEKERERGEGIHRFSSVFLQASPSLCQLMFRTKPIRILSPLPPPAPLASPYPCISLSPSLSPAVYPVLGSEVSSVYLCMHTRTLVNPPTPKAQRVGNDLTPPPRTRHRNPRGHEPGPCRCGRATVPRPKGRGQRWAEGEGAARRAGRTWFPPLVVGTSGAAEESQSTDHETEKKVIGAERRTRGRAARDGGKAESVMSVNGRGKRGRGGLIGRLEADAIEPSGRGTGKEKSRRPCLFSKEEGKDASMVAWRIADGRAFARSLRSHADWRGERRRAEVIRPGRVERRILARTRLETTPTPAH